MRFFINFLWLYPMAVVVCWTIVTALAAWTSRLNKPFPGVLGIHPMMMLLNPKDDKLYKRPSALMIFLFLVIGVIPVVNFAIGVYLIGMLIAYLFMEKQPSKQG